MTQVEFSQANDPTSFAPSPEAERTFAARKGFRNVFAAQTGIVFDGPFPIDGVELQRIVLLLNAIPAGSA